KKKKVTRSRKKVVAPESKEETKIEATPEVKNEEPTVENKPSAKKTAKSSKQEVAKEVEKPVEKPATKPIPKMPTNLVIRDFCDLANSGGYIPLLSDQQIQQLTYEEAYERNLIFEAIISNVLDYDIVLSDTNIWLELLVGHTSSHSDPRVNARLMFERQLEFISKMCKKIGGKFTIMSETYEEVDRFATMQEPTDYKLADWKDPALCLNVAARLAKRLMLYQQKENRLRIEGIGSESHHASFADPAIIRRTVELFAMGKKVLLLTNDASVAIRSLGMCDDLQRTNDIGDAEWREVYEPQRPMVLTMDDLKLLDQYTRQYHFLTLAAGRQWMQDVQMRQPAQIEKPLALWAEGFRPGDRRERRSDRLEQQKKEYEKQRQEQERKEQARLEQERKEQNRLEQERREAEKQARREEQERREQENRERKEQARLEQQRREEQRREEQRRADRERAAAEKALRLAAEEEARKQQAAEQAAKAEGASVVEAPTETVIETPVQDAVPVEPAKEEVPVIELPPLSPEMMELMGPSSSDKKRTRRGGRRRKTTTETAEQK
ncbi:MAG: hypothetical protein IKX25_07160, partial [Bacteroidales bacterium]|nr:hypothetical protein [Bacteroidales bacterium]